MGHDIGITNCVYAGSAALQHGSIRNGADRHLISASVHGRVVLHTVELLIIVFCIDSDTKDILKTNLSGLNIWTETHL